MIGEMIECEKVEEEQKRDKIGSLEQAFQIISQTSILAGS